ncbi:Bacterial CdiA-CT RNAse A domain protein [anaerobic digester metagenome]
MKAKLYGDNVGNDILDQMKAAGGHTLEKHVSKTNEYLIERALREDVEAAKSFTNKSTAIKAVKQNFAKNADEIVEWLEKPRDARKAFDVTHNYGIGKGVLSDKKVILNDLTKSRIVLVKDATQDLGFRIISAFPVVK